MCPNVGYDWMGGMYYLRVIMLKKLEGIVPVPYPIQNRVKVSPKGPPDVVIDCGFDQN